MNTKADILARLLRLFPAERIKDQWQRKGKKQENVSSIAESQKEDEIKFFAKKYAGLTKQIVYIRNPVPISDGKGSLIPEGELVANEVNGGVREHFYLLNLVYDVILREPLEQVKVKFLWPVRVIFEPEHLRVHITLMEKNVASYFPDNRAALFGGKNLEEWMIVESIISALPSKQDASAFDLNKGVKALWASDLFDALSARWKEPKDTTSKTMDKDCLLKKDNPKAYENLINTPLLKTAFKFLKKTEDYPDHFWADPNAGMISISTYSENVNIAENVIRKILKSN